MRILIAHSDPETASRCRAHFYRQPHEVEVVVDAASCLTYIRHCMPDALLLGSDLPTGGADVVLNSLRKLKLLAKPAVILICSQSTQHEFPRLPPVIGYIKTPFHWTEILTVLDSIPNRA